jgi:hypothetical protein
MRGRTCRKAASKTELDLPILRRLRSATARFPPRGKCGRAQIVSGSHRGVTLSWLMPPPSIAIPPAAAAGFGISRADNGASPSAISAEIDRCAADVVVEFDDLGRRAALEAQLADLCEPEGPLGCAEMKASLRLAKTVPASRPRRCGMCVSATTSANIPCTKRNTTRESGSAFLPQPERHPPLLIGFQLVQIPSRH